jgi:exopolysaccharide biosynthesis polyprenyl glycosylphosphotransferase
MLRQHREIRQRIQMVVDAGLLYLSLYLAHALRSHWQFEVLGGTREIFPFDDYQMLGLLILPVGPLALRVGGLYQRAWVAERLATAWALLRGCSILVITLILLLWLIRGTHEIARSVLVFFGAISFSVLWVKEEVVSRWRGRHGANGRAKPRIIIAGPPAETTALARELEGAHGEDFEVAACLDLNISPVELLVELMHQHSPNGVLLAAQHTMFGQIEQAIALCEREGVEVWLLADFFKPQISKTSVGLLLGRPVLFYRSTPASVWPLFAKQAMDSVGAFVLLVGLSPLLLAVALGIRLTARGPVLFRQQRSGLNGRPFTMLKFRSMVTNAEQLRHELEALNEMSGPVFKVTDDPRITSFGRFLRKYSLDELPQLWNVLTGDMSLVGPRPLPVAEVERFDDPAHRRRLSVKPGLTCLWQISGRSHVRDFQEWVKLDLQYIDNWSLWLDLSILLRTLPVVISGAGAK